MSKRRPYVGLDIGSEKIAVMVGFTGSDDQPVDIIGVGSAKTSGVRRGEIIDTEEVISAISAALEEAERMSGIPIERATVGIATSQVEASIVRGVIAVSHPDNTIAPEDVERAIDNARTLNIPVAKSVLHVVPRNFVIDGTTSTKDPIGAIGMKLEAETFILTLPGPQINSLNKVLYASGIEIQDLVLSVLADSKSVLSKKQKDIGVAVVNLGAGVTSLAVFEDGTLLSASVLPVGASHLTNDIAIGLRTTLDVAEAIKVRFGMAQSSMVSDRELIDISSFDPTDNHTTSQKFVADIIEARLTEIFDKVNEELHKVGKDHMLPAGVVLTGGGAKIPGIVNIAKEVLGLPASLGQPTREYSGVIDQLDDPSFSTSLGLMLWGMEEEAKEGGGKGGAAAKLSGFKGGVGGIVGKAKDFVKQFLP